MVYEEDLSVEVFLKEEEATESATDNCSQKSGEKIPCDEAMPKEVDTMKPECTDIQTETHDFVQKNDQAGAPNFTVLDPEKGHINVLESMGTQTERNDRGQKDEHAVSPNFTFLEPGKVHVDVSHINKELLTSDRSTRLERNLPWGSLSHDLEVPQNKHSREAIQLHSPTEIQEFRQNQSNLVLHQEHRYSVQVSKAAVVKESVVGEALVCETKDSEVITTVNKILEANSHAGISVEEIFDDIRYQSMDKSKPSTSGSRVQQEPADAYVKKSFTCDNSMADEDEELREHWTRTLQTSTSTGEIVEEIVRVLKHQKTHDLLCPVCGSCITKRVVLRKRKRSSLISVDRWYQDHLEEDVEIQVQDSSIKITDSVNEQESGLPVSSDGLSLDTMAYGCLACFSLFFRKGHRLWSQVEGAAEQDTMSCLPFFFPPYPWGMNRRRKSRTALAPPSPVQEGSISPAVGDLAISQDAVEKEDVATTKAVTKGEVQPWFDKCSLTCGLAPALLSDFHWSTKKKDSLAVQKEDVVMENEVEADDVTCDLSSVVLPAYKWGQAMKSEGEWKASAEDEKIVQEEIHLKAHIKTKTDVSVGPSQKIAVLKESVKLNEDSAVEKSPTHMLSSASTGYALLEGLSEKTSLTKRPSTGFSVLDPGTSPQVGGIPGSQDDLKPISQEIDLSLTAIQKSKGVGKPIGWRFPSFLWSIGKVSADDLTKPLLKKPAELKGKNFVPSEETKSESLVSVFKIEPSDVGSVLAPSIPAMPELEDEILQKIRPVLKKPVKDKIQIVVEAQPSDEVPPRVEVTTIIPEAVTTTQPREGWDILRSIVYGGLDISLASLGVTSSAAGGDAITRTVVYMGVATLFSGIIGFYHNVVNLYYHYREHYRTTVGKTLLLNGTVAVISYLLFGMLSSVTYAFSFRESNNRDKKFALCCGVTFISMFLLSLAKAFVTNRSFLRTISAYIFGGFFAAVIGYLTGEHVAELLESWGI